MFNNSKTFFIVMFVGASIWCLYLGHIAIEGLKASGWPSVDGVITSGSAKRIDHSKERYIIEVEYKYSVGHKNFIGNRLSNLNALLDSSEKDSALKRYSTDSSVKVHYDPNNPQNSYLVTGVHLVTYVLWLACVGMVIFSAVHLKKLFRT
ncbi:DUF3592 domain-containing protein [Rheinheimera sp. 1928-s]|uniref:DUF3592 domain-containing protein n=1 Tax=Rheinheimera sp. 1928-s TaxID=3033803 RepID=UPI002621AB55|nr:DUF3592 domain-containing protein [Rheinheimera sp. 1928-s]MDF3126937.1 DUF3592 domain-containing protein [Rheinheimera sp. 1928-s]